MASVFCKSILWFGRHVLLACDANCAKAWGINCRPCIHLSAEPDDYVFAPDDMLGFAPADPGTYEGGHGKPSAPDERGNKWCARECERSIIVEDGERLELRDYAHPRSNIPASQGAADAAIAAARARVAKGGRMHWRDSCGRAVTEPGEETR